MDYYDRKIVTDKKILVVDDIADTGHTLKDFDNEHNVVCTFHYHKQSLTVPEFFCEEKTDEWIVYPWEVKKDEEEIYYLIKNFKFKNFLESQNFINRVGEIAEKEGHHPDIWFGWGYAKIKIFTHAIKGLHESDFVLAAKVDKII